MNLRLSIGYTQNIGTKERLTSFISGSYLLYNALSNKHKNILKALTGGYMLFRGATGYCPFNSAVGIKEVETHQDVDLKTNITVNKPRKEVYEFWRNLENLPKIMDHIIKVKILDEKTSEWQAKMPGGIGKVSWKSEITNDIKNEFISWQSIPNSTIENIGSVGFKDAGEFGTDIQVDITYRAPLGTAGKRIAMMLNPVFEVMVIADIKDFKHIIEEGTAPIVNGDPS